MQSGLIDGLTALVFAEENLSRAYGEVLQAMRNASNAPRRSRDRYLARLATFSANRATLLHEIMGRYRDGNTPEFKRFITKIPKKPRGPNERPISLFSFEERVILRSMLSVLWPLLEPSIVPHICYCTYRAEGGAHPPRGIRDAVKFVGEKRASQRPYIFESDISGFFDGIDRKRLLETIRPKLSDEPMELLLTAVLEAETIFDPGEFALDERNLLNTGVPQGSALSPLLACCYLTPFDEEMDSEGWAMVRYVDDLVVLCDSEECANRAQLKVEGILARDFNLQLSAKKTHVRGPDEPLDFLGHTIFPNGRLMPSPRRVRSVREKVFTIINQLPGKKDREVVVELTSYLLGFFHNMSHCSFTEANYRTYSELVGDALVHRRLDRKRLSRALRRSSQKWPSAFLKGLP